VNGCIVVRWGANIPGRETKGLEVFGEAIEYFEGLAKQGRIHSHHEYITLTGRDGGFMIADGEVGELTKIMTSTETLQLNGKAAAIVEDFEVQLYGGGNDQSIQELIGTYVSGMQSIGYM
jgi:hypothetical protein